MAVSNSIAGDPEATAQDETAPTLQRYLDIVSTYDTEFKKWLERCRRIIRRYRDDERDQTNNDAARFNILWSNVQTLTPAVYAKVPKAEVSRRFRDQDPVARVACLILERALDYEVEHYPEFRAAMSSSVLDRFLGGRGVAWVRYEPHVREQEAPEDGLEITEDVENEGAGGPDAEAAQAPMADDIAAAPAAAETADGAPASEVAAQPDAPSQGGPQEQIDYECCPTDYVHWKDFGHSVARTWEEVDCVWRWVYLTREACVERFGEEVGASIPLTQGQPDPLQNRVGRRRSGTLAKVCELWDKSNGKAVWFYDGGRDLLDVRDDPLGLEEFFPCPKPLYATITSDTLVPVPDFAQYQDQANELDILTDRIDGLVKALRVRGVYDASVPALQRLMTEGDNTVLIPVDKYMAFTEKGGLARAVDFLPLDMIAKALLEAYKAHDQIKAQIYEITGLSDIVRGASAASETATAQQIKSQFASMRLRQMKDEVAAFASGLLGLKAQIMCRHYQPETLLLYACADQFSDADKQMIPQALALLQQDGALAAFRIQVAADSLVQLDEQQHKQERLEFIEAVGGFLQKALPVVLQAPQAAPMIVTLLKFGIGAFKEAKSIEGELDDAIDRMREQAQQAQAAGGQQQKPDPEMVKAQAQAQATTQRAQLEAVRTQSEVQSRQALTQSDLLTAQQDRGLQAAETNARIVRTLRQPVSMAAPQPPAA